MIKVLLLILYTGCSMNMGYTILAPFFPSQIMQRGLSPLYNSAIFAIYAFSYIGLSSAIASIFIPRYGRVKTFTCSAVMLCGSIFVYGCLYYIGNSQIFIVLSLVTRLIQGSGVALFLVSGFAILAAVFEQRTGMVTALHQIGMRLGLTLGPLLGSFLYKAFGFVGPFFCVAALSIPPILLSCIGESKAIPDGKRAHNEVLVPNQKIKICNRRAVFAYLAFGLSMMKLAVLETTLSDKLMLDFNFTPDQVALYLFAYTGSSTVLCFFLPLVPERIDKRYLIVPANLICGISSFFIGPSSTFSIANRSSTVLGGLIVGGAFSAVVPCFVLAEAITATQRYIQPDQQQAMLNKVAGYRTCFHGFGLLLGPIMAGFVMFYFGFPKVMEIMGLIMVGLGVTDIVFIVKERQAERRYEEAQRSFEQQPRPEGYSSTDLREEEILLVQEERDSSGGSGYKEDDKELEGENQIQETQQQS